MNSDMMIFFVDLPNLSSSCLVDDPFSFISIKG